MSEWTAYTPWIVLIGTTGVCVLSTLYIALTTVPRASVEDVATLRNEPARGQRALTIMDDAPRYARAVGFLKLVFDLVTVAALMGWIASLRGAGRLEWVDALLGVLAGAGVLWVFGLVVPMSVARYAGARVIYSRTVLLRAVAATLSPLGWLGRFVDEVIRRLAGAERKDSPEQVQEEILQVIEEGEARGAIDGDEREMIESVVRFGDLTAAQIMTPRTEIEAMELTNNLGEVTRRVKELGHSRIPVYEESLDHVVGIFYVKDLLHWLAGGGGKAFDLRAILRPAYFVPETKTVRELLKELMDKKVHIALIADEYGGTAGLVTIEDIVEEIFGDIKDEYENPQAEHPDVIVRAETRSAEIEATARVADVNDAIYALGVQIPDSEEYDTVGGFVGATLGRIPAQGERFTHEQMEFTIAEAKPNRVVKVVVKVTGEKRAEV